MISRVVMDFFRKQRSFQSPKINLNKNCLNYKYSASLSNSEQLVEATDFRIVLDD